MDGPWRPYARWNKSEKDKRCMLSLLCENKQKRTKPSSKIQGTTDWWLPEVEGGWRVGKLGDGSPKNRLTAIKWIHHGDVMYNIVTVVNNAVLHIWKFKVDLKLSHSVQFSHSVVSDSLRPHRLQHARLPCPSPTPRAYLNSCLSLQEKNWGDFPGSPVVRTWCSHCPEPRFDF